MENTPPKPSDPAAPFNTQRKRELLASIQYESDQQDNNYSLTTYLWNGFPGYRNMPEQEIVSEWHEYITNTRDFWLNNKEDLKVLLAKTFDC